MKRVFASMVGLFFAATACGGPVTGSTTPFKTANIMTPTIETAIHLTSPNMPPNATYPAVAAWTMYPLTLNPNPARAGQPVEIWTNVYMVDFLITFIIARLEINGVQVDQARWMLYIDESDPHDFVFTPPAPGIYNITITANLEENEAYNQKGGEQLSISQSAILTVT